LKAQGGTVRGEMSWFQIFADRDVQWRRNATEQRIAAKPTIGALDAIVTEMNAHSSDDARDVVKAAHIIMKGNRDDICRFCKPWGVQLKVQKRYRPMGTIKQELKMSLTKRAMELREIRWHGYRACSSKSKHCYRACCTFGARRKRAGELDLM
jgi:hypothetical protein